MRNCQDILFDVYGRRDYKSNDGVGMSNHREREFSHNDNHNCDNQLEQTHTHEFEGSVKIAEPRVDPHNHRFAGVTGQAIPLPNGNHFHKLDENTDFYEDHFHMVIDKTGPAIPVGNGRHVHFVSGQTTLVDGHRHEFQFAAAIDNPIGD